MMILDGKKTAQIRQNQLKNRVVKFETVYGRAPHLVVVLVGDFAPSEIYVRNKQLACERVGIKSTLLRLPSEISEEAFVATLKKINSDDLVDGVLVQEPLPAQLSRHLVAQTLSFDKDADCVTFEATGILWAGEAVVSPCTPMGVMNLLGHYGMSVEGLNCVVVGRSALVGKPMAALLLQANASVTVLHSQSKNVKQICRNADLVVVAAGKKKFFDRDDFKAGAVVIDVGIHREENGQIVGDVNPANLDSHLLAFTPVPGGVGPMTIDSLLHNTVLLAEKRLKERGS